MPVEGLAGLPHQHQHHKQHQNHQQQPAAALRPAGTPSLQSMHYASPVSPAAGPRRASRPQGAGGKRGKAAAQDGSAAAGSGGPCCQVPGCQQDLARLKDYHQRYRICAVHIKLPEVGPGCYVPPAPMATCGCSTCRPGHPRALWCQRLS
jgi:hypothetical protein